MWRANYRGKTITPGHQHNASMSPYFPNTSSHQWMCIYREVSPTTLIRAQVFFFFFFFLRLDGSAAVGFHEDRVNSVPKAVTLTNNPCSLELSSGHTEESMLLPPLLL